MRVGAKISLSACFIRQLLAPVVGVMIRVSGIDLKVQYGIENEPHYDYSTFVCLGTSLYDWTAQSDSESPQESPMNEFAEKSEVNIPGDSSKCQLSDVNNSSLKCTTLA